MKKPLLIAVALATLAIGPSFAQVVTAPAGTVAMVCANNSAVPTPTSGKFFYVQCDSNGKLITNGTGGTGSGTVTSVSVTTANGISGTAANPTTTPAITLTLGAITPTTVNGNTITSGTGTLTLGSATLNVGTGGTLGSNAFTSTAYAPLASPTFTGTVTAPTFNATSSYNISGAVAIEFVGNYLEFFDPATNLIFLGGNATDPSNYYNNTSHFLRSRNGLVTFATVNSSGINLGSGEAYAVNSVSGLASKTCTINTANAATGITITITGGLVTGTTTC